VPADVILIRSVLGSAKGQVIVSILRPTTREWVLYPDGNPDPAVKVLDGLCHWQQNLFLVGPGVAEYIRPPLTFWGRLKLEGCPPLPILAQLHMQTETGHGQFLPVCVRLSDGGQVVFVDSVTVGVLKKTPEDFPWPPPELPGPAKAKRVAAPQQERESDRFQHPGQGLVDDPIPVRGRTDLAFLGFVNEEAAVPGR
jgi:hypothetical protein